MLLSAKLINRQRCVTLQMSLQLVTNFVVETNHRSIFILIKCCGGVSYKDACVQTLWRCDKAVASKGKVEEGQLDVIQFEPFLLL